MSLKTKLLELFKYEPDKDGAQTFNIKSALNDNWDKIEAWAQSVKTALTKLVPTSRTVNGKTLAEDVTLTAADIKMPDSEEDVGAAMAKRPLKQYPKALDVHKITIGQLYWCDEDTANTPYKAGLTGYTQGVALCTAGSAEEKWCSIIYIVHAGKDVWLQHRDQNGWKDWVQLAKCETPEVHELPLADGWTPLTDDCTYCKTQENIVTVNIRAQHSTTISGISRETVATLPTGFRPTRWISSACALDSGDSGGAMNGGVHVDASGSVIINGFDSYRVVYAQISFLAVN